MGADNTFGETNFNPETMDKKPTAEGLIIDNCLHEYIDEDGDKRVEFVKSTLIELLEAHANNAVEEMSKEITRLQEKYDENGYEFTPLIKLRRMESYIDAGFDLWKQENNKLKSAVDEVLKEFFDSLEFKDYLNCDPTKRDEIVKQFLNNKG